MDEKKEILKISHLTKSFGNHEVLKDIDFMVNTGDIISIIGASGSGKSTLLRCINMLETPNGGQILYHEKNITDPKLPVASYREKVGMVFQNFNLFQNMTVLDNCMVGPIKVAGKSKENAKELALRFLTVYQCKTKTAFRWTETTSGNSKSTCNGTGDSPF